MNHLHSKSDSQLRAEKAAILRELSRRRRAAKPKRQTSARKRDALAKEAWELFARSEKHCWACGRTRTDVPHFWWARWLLERAHVVNKTRIRNPKACVVLCSCCHKLAHGEKVAGCELPPLTKSHLLHLLMEHQAVDWTLLRKHNVGALPDPEPLPLEYIRSMYKFCGWH